MSRRSDMTAFAKTLQAKADFDAAMGATVDSAPVTAPRARRQRRREESCWGLTTRLTTLIQDGRITYGFAVPLRTVSLKNKREHWAQKARRTKTERNTTAWAMFYAWAPGTILELKPTECATVTLTRVAPRALDGDNLTMSLSAVRDQIADELSLPDDRDGYWLRWVYDQRKGKPKQYAVDVLIEVSAAERVRP